MAITRPILINDEVPNIFGRLLSYRVRADRDSKENFLTEAFAYVLATNPNGARKIIHALVQPRFEVAKLVSIRTQVSIGDDDSRKSFPDLMFEARDAQGCACEVWIENKWGSPADGTQLATYVEKLTLRPPKIRRHLVLLTPRFSDAQVTELCAVARSGVSLSHVTWARIHELVRTHCAHPIEREFERFLIAQQLGLGTICRNEALEHWKAQQRGRVSVEHPLRRKLWQLCERVRADLTPGTPLIEDAATHDAYGRVAIWTFDHKITVGFLYNTRDHGAAFLDPTRPLDIVVRIEGPLGQKEAEHFRSKLAPLAQKLEQAEFVCGHGGWRSNPHTALLGQYNPGFPFELPASEQYLHILQVFRSTLGLIAADGQAMATLRQIPSY